MSSRIPPLWPQIHLLKPGSGDWFMALLGVTLLAACVIASYWAAATFGWMTAAIALRTRSRRDFIAFSIFWSVLLLPIAAVIIYFGGLIQFGLAISLWLVPIIHFTQADAQLRKIAPIYSRAIAKLKFGKYADAEAEVIHELEKDQENFEGWMMLAEMYAHHFNDLPQADRTIRELCHQPNITRLQRSIALHRLADWHLKLGNDPDAACAALVELCQQARGTHFARMAQLRISQLPLTKGDLVAQRDKKFRVPAPAADLTEPDETIAKSPLSREDALALANDYTAKLKQDPNNVAARERFATILAEDLGKVDLALEQLDLLVGMPDQPETKTAKWLSQMARWQLRYRRDEDATRELMERLVHEYPQTPEAFAAQRHLNLMELERRFKRAAAARER
ncbi:MAG: hypothetical protein L0Z50_30795 [Verrucomicrobiales bacterium]|nr:hypothetical protein [Verrucomicrobiales bacterium]